MADEPTIAELDDSGVFAAFRKRNALDLEYRAKIGDLAKARGLVRAAERKLLAELARVRAAPPVAAKSAKPRVAARLPENPPPDPRTFGPRRQPVVRARAYAPSSTTAAIMGDPPPGRTPWS